MKRFKNILFLADGDDAGSPALLRAVALAESNQARLTLFDAIEPIETLRRKSERWHVDIAAVLRQQRRETLAGLIKPFEGGDEITYTEVMSGIPFIEVIRAVQRNSYDLVVRGVTPPSGIAGRLFGSTDLHLPGVDRTTCGGRTLSENSGCRRSQQFGSPHAESHSRTGRIAGGP